jgi:hypothetical protein
MGARATEFAEEAAEHFAANPGALFIPSLPFARNAMLSDSSNIRYAYRSEDEAFPQVRAGIRTVGHLLLVQIRQPLARTAGGIEIPSDQRKTDFDNTQVAKVLEIGPVAFKSRETGEYWPEGAWCKVGDYIRIAKYQPDYIVREYKREDTWYDEETGRECRAFVRDYCHFALLKDLAVLGVYDSLEDAMSARAYLG